MATIFEFDGRDAASAAAAARMAGLIDTRLKRDAAAKFVLTGGSSPAKCYKYLSAYDLDWQATQAVLSDERWVPNTHCDSNERLVAENLLVNKASKASVLPVYQDDMSVDERCDALQDRFPALGFACALLGMGADGHIASLFPDSDNLQVGLSTDNERFYLPVRTAASPHPRVSMTLNALLRSKEIMLLSFGDEKRAVYERANSGDTTLPVHALLTQEQAPVNLYWAP